MNVRTLCLAILNVGNATGYEIKKLSIEGKYSYFVDASFGSIYPALSKLETDGLVTSRQELQSGKPPRKIYSITDSGRSALIEALMEPPGPDLFRSEFLLVAMCAEMLPRDTITAAIDDRLRMLNEELSHLKSVVEETGDQAAKWAAQYGVSCISCSIAHLTASRETLEAVAGTKIENTAAAE